MEYMYLVEAGLIRDVAKLVVILARAQRKIDRGLNCCVCCVELHYIKCWISCGCEQKMCFPCSVKSIKECKTEEGVHCYWYLSTKPHQC